MTTTQFHLMTTTVCNSAGQGAVHSSFEIWTMPAASSHLGNVRLRTRARAIADRWQTGRASQRIGDSFLVRVDPIFP